MQELAGKVAVVTGAASGIGLAMARRFAREGMRLVCADVQKDALDTAVAELGEAGIEAIGVITDVRDTVQVDALADATFERFGAAHVVCNNAGVGGSRGNPV